MEFLGAPVAWRIAACLVAVITGGVFPARRAVASIRILALDINALMLVAVVGAMFLGEWSEAGTVVFLFAIAQWLESRSLDRAREAIRTLLDLTPVEARVRHGDHEEMVAIDRVSIGTVMVVRPGEKIPLDGSVVTGRSDVNQAPITGESLPADKGPGDEVFAGTINGHGALEVAVTRKGRDTTLARIIHLVEDAQAQRAPSQQFIDRFARWYTPAVIILAVLVAAVPPLLGGAFDTWFYRALVLLVVSCPCALVISTPVSVVSALAGAARRGVLIKGGVHLERLAAIKTIAFDKTGTLTRGKLRVTAVHPADGITESALIAVAAAVEARSEHPVAAAIAGEASARRLTVEPADGVRALPGLGAEGVVSGARVVCGNVRLFREQPYAQWFLNSVTQSLGFGALSVALCTMAGYALAKYRFRGNNAIFLGVLVSQMIPFNLLIVSLFFIIIQLGLKETYWGAIIPLAASPIGLFFMRVYCMSVNDEMMDSARVDGANEYRIFWSVAVPNMRPGLATLFILFALEYWNNLLWPLIVFTKKENMPLAVGLNTMINAYQTQYDLVLAGSVLATVPIIILFFFLRRQFMEGSSFTGTGVQ